MKLIRYTGKTLKLFFILTAIICYSSCRPKKFTNSLSSKEFQIYLSSYKSQIHAQFGVHSTTIDSSTFIFFMTRQNEILFMDLADKKNIYSYNFSNYISGINLFDIKIINNFFYLWDHDHKHLLQFEINRRGAEFKKLYDLTKLLDWKKFYIKFQFNNTFELNGPHLFLSYGIYDPNFTFLDHNSYLKINLDQYPNFQNVEKIFNYPEVFRKGKFYNSNTYIKFFNDSCLLYAFRTYDSMYKINRYSNKITSRILLNTNANYRRFNLKKIKDLSYVRWYETTNEFNSNTIIDKNNNVILLKKIKKKELHDIDKYEYYILDKELKMKYNNIFNHTVNPKFLFSFLNGFLIFNESLDKAYYYEVP